MSAPSIHSERNLVSLHIHEGKKEKEESKKNIKEEIKKETRKEEKKEYEHTIEGYTTRHRRNRRITNFYLFLTLQSNWNQGYVYFKSFITPYTYKTLDSWMEDQSIVRVLPT
jgi:hypothetical protein